MFLKLRMILFRFKAAHFRKAPSSQDSFRPNWQELSIYLLPLNIHVPDDNSPICTTGDELPSVVSIGERLNFITGKETRQLAISHLGLLHKWAQSINKAVQTICLPICFPRCIHQMQTGLCCQTGARMRVLLIWAASTKAVLVTVFAALGIGGPSCTGKPQQSCSFWRHIWMHKWSPGKIPPDCQNVSNNFVL